MHFQVFPEIPLSVSQMRCGRFLGNIQAFSMEFLGNPRHNVDSFNLDTRNFTLQPYFEFAHSSTQTIYPLLYLYLFEECYLWRYHGQCENSGN